MNAPGDSRPAEAGLDDFAEFLSVGYRGLCEALTAAGTTATVHRGGTGTYLLRVTMEDRAVEVTDEGRPLPPAARDVHRWALTGPGDRVQVLAGGVPQDVVVEAILVALGD